MSDCCSSSNNTASAVDSPSRHSCPSNGENCMKVDYATVLHHVKSAWAQNIADQAYYFCDAPECDVVYIGLDDSLITKSMLRSLVGVKEDDDTALICYCFDVTKAEAKSDRSAYQFVVEQTKKSNCSCKTSNPSGRCCLKDFPKARAV
ncbi:MAG: hypothetical protein OEX07_11500 [Gammaproteobacteria bacterium]|nr:hypothetical protein [Gammaproteobacteria bacterium]